MRVPRPADASAATYNCQSGRHPPHDTAVAAIAAFQREELQGGRAVELGCGAGRDTLALLEAGFRVTSIDRDERSLELLRGRLEPLKAEKTSLLLTDFERADWPRADLVCASRSLHCCHPRSFPRVWSRIVASLRIGGRFAGHFLGERDGWASRADLSHVRRESLDDLLRGFEVELLREEEREGEVLEAGALVPHRWHLWHVVARLGEGRAE